MRALLVGGAGFIGSHLARRLVSAGHEVTILDNLSPQIHGRDARFRPELESIARCIRGDARVPTVLGDSLVGQDILYWLVAETGTGQSMYQVERYVRTNIGALALLFDLLIHRAGSVGRIVLTSSRAVYGEGAYHCVGDGEVVPVSRTGFTEDNGWNPVCPRCAGRITPIATREDCPPHPTSVYGWSKLGQEQLLGLLSGATGIERAVLRLQNVYGPGQALGNPYTGVLMTFCNRALKGLPLVLYEDGEITRDFVYVDDVVTALARAGELKGLDGDPMNVGSGRPVSIRTAAEVIREKAGSRSLIEVGGQFRVGDIRYALPTLDRLKGQLSVAPEVTFEEGIRRVVAWTRAQPATRDRSKSTARKLEALGLLKVADR